MDPRDFLDGEAALDGDDDDESFDEEDGPKKSTLNGGLEDSSEEEEDDDDEEAARAVSDGYGIVLLARLDDETDIVGPV